MDPKEITLTLNHFFLLDFSDYWVGVYFLHLGVNLKLGPKLMYFSVYNAVNAT
jgi:hypothetical protein